MSIDPDSLSEMQHPLLSVEGLTKRYEQQGIWRRHSPGVTAVDDVSFDIGPSETLGLVGESGSGKSTIARLLTRLTNPTAGSAFFEGEDIFAMDSPRLRSFRSEMQMVFQDPYASLDPRMTVEEIISEGWDIHESEAPAADDRSPRVMELLETVGMSPEMASRHPHSFSGGQRQRIGIARALALKPRLIVCDEPVSALDVSVQAQVINLFQDLQEAMSVSYLFIAHDLSVVRHISHKIAVMYAGKFVEYGPTEEIFKRPTHPYTRLLLDSIPLGDRTARESRQANPRTRRHELPTIENERESAGCAFAPRCPLAAEHCWTNVPSLVPLSDGRKSACFFAEDELTRNDV